MNVILIHKLINDLPISFYLKHKGKDIRELIEPLKDNIIYKLNDLYEGYNYINIPKDLNEILYNYLIKGYNFDLIHYLKVLANITDFNNLEDYLKHDFMIKYYQKEETELLNQKCYKKMCERLLNDDDISDLTISEYISFMLYDEYYYKELTDQYI